MIPPQIVERKVSDAERQVFDLLDAIDVPGWTYCFHSLDLPDHKYKRACEIDFLLLGERGLLALEVKGGGVSCSNGVWQTQTSRSGVRQLSESPFQQAQSARAQLELKLRRELGAEVARRTIFGHGVVFPEVDFTIRGIEWAPDMAIDRSHIGHSAFLDALDNLGQYWERKDDLRGTLTPAEVEAYRSKIRPAFELVPGIVHTGRKIERHLRTLTQQQYRVLDECEGNARLIIDGGAGTGKTMLAAEIVRRSKVTGMRTLVTCRSIVLTEFLRRQPGIAPEDAVQFDRLGDLDPSSVDFLIVDEAQDIINEHDLSVINRSLIGGLEHGRWVLLLDSNNQQGLVGSFEEAPMRFLTEDIRAARRRLIDNCRNTTEIVKDTQSRTGADIGIAPAGHGDPVVFIDGTRDDVAGSMAEILDRLETDSQLSDVVLLSHFELRKSVFHTLPAQWRKRVDRLDLMKRERLESGRIGFAQVADFKGLESRYVFLETPLTEDADLERRLLYVGMTRARAGLWLVSGSRQPDGGSP